jgi:hypothetical protein
LDWREFVFSAWYRAQAAPAREVKMPKPQSIRNMALFALPLGLTFLGLNLYLDATGHPKLANLFFMLGILSNVAFAGLAVFWGLCSAWVREPERPPAPMQMPGAVAQKKPPQP